MKASLSVIVAVRNGRRFLRQALESILAEKIEDLELIVVDDCSTDGTVQAIQDLPVFTHRLSRPSGQAAALNRGVELAGGDTIAFLDSDDLLASGGLRRRLEYLVRNPNVSVLAGEVAGVLDSEGKYLGEFRDVILPNYRAPTDSIDRSYFDQGGQFPSYLWLQMFRADFLRAMGPFDEKYRCALDNDFFHRVLAKSAIKFLPVRVAFYRLHEHNTSGAIRDGVFNLSKLARAETLFVHLEHGVSFL